MTATARGAQAARARDRQGRLAKARARRLELDKDREARDARMDAAIADFYDAQDERAHAVEAVRRAEARMGEAMIRLKTEGVATAQVTELLELRAGQLQRLKIAAAQRATFVASTAETN